MCVSVGLPRLLSTLFFLGVPSFLNKILLIPFCVAIFIGSEVGIFFESAGEMALRRKTEVEGDLDGLFVCVTKKFFPFLYFSFKNIL